MGYRLFRRIRPNPFRSRITHLGVARLYAGRKVDRLPSDEFQQS